MTVSILLSSAMAMNTQSHAMGQISGNITNMNTVGYKHTESLFQTQLVAERGNKDFYSARPTDRRDVSREGSPQTTGRTNDLCIQGQGLFILSQVLGAQGQELDLTYSRAGDFNPKVVTENDTEKTYLANSSGYYVLGWNYSMDTKSFGTSLEPMNITPLSEIVGFPTENLDINANLSSEPRAGIPEKLVYGVYDANCEAQTMQMVFSQNAANIWDFGLNISNATSIAGMPEQIVFNQDATIKSPAAPFTLQVTWEDGSSTSIEVDLSKLTQYAGQTLEYNTKNDGAPKGTLSGAYWDKDGVLQATYSNARTVPVCKVALAKFVAPDSLEALSGTMFRETTQSGAAEIIDLTEHDITYSSILSEAVEMANVDLADEFTRIITTQKAYTSASKVFQTGDEMYQEAIQMKQ